jgi:hypothetical protein
MKKAGNIIPLTTSIEIIFEVVLPVWIGENLFVSGQCELWSGQNRLD